MGKFQNSSAQKKQTGKYLRLGIGAFVIIMLAVLPMLASRNEESQESQASVLSATVQLQKIETQIIGGGQLSSEASLRIRIPENVKLTKYLVGNGDVVLEGDAIARVDRVSVMTAITQVQETLDYLSGKIAEIGEDTASTSVRALTGGTVKVIYGAEGDSVQDVMLEHGALAVLSLDGMMAVQIQRSTSLAAGDTVCVTFSDGTEAEGQVKSNLDGLLTVTLEDEDYCVGEKVTVTTEEGKRLGSGELYILSPWTATADSGRIANVYVKENTVVAAGRTLFSLEDTGHTAQFQRLIDQRQEYEQLMQELFAMYRTETLTAPCDGIVTGVEEEGAFLLSGEQGNWFVSLLSSFRKQPEDGFVVCPAQVEAVTAEGLKLRMTPRVTPLTDFGTLSQIQADPSAMTESWDYTGDTRIWSQDADGLLHDAGTAKAGDVLLVVGDESQVHWLVLPAENGTAQQTRITAPGMFAFLLSDGNTEESIPETSAPEETVPETSAPEETVPETSAPEETVPETSAPEETVPETSTPEETVPEESTPEDSDPEEDLPENPEPTPQTGTIYLGYPAQVTAVEDGKMTVQQAGVPYAILDRSNLPSLTADAAALTQEVTYTSSLITENLVTAGDCLLLVVKQDGTLVDYAKLTLSTGNSQAAGQQLGAAQGAMPGSGSTAGSTSVQIFEPYTLETLTVASVTSQEHMTVSITVDELDIGGLYVGQEAVVSVDALGGQQFEAEVTGISNSAENSGGNSKFAVEITLEKGGEMLPGMYASACITLQTREDIPCIPVAALDTDGSDSIVYTGYDAKSGTLSGPVAVTIGASDGESVEILEGLAPGQICYYEYYDTYTGSNAPSQRQGGFDLGRMLRGR